MQLIYCSKPIFSSLADQAKNDSGNITAIMAKKKHSKNRQH